MSGWNRFAREFFRAPAAGGCDRRIRVSVIKPPRTASLGLSLLCLLCALAGSGCTSGFTKDAQHGLVIYCPGAGNWDLGDSGIRDGLRKAGFKGQVSSVTWSVLANPLIDQTLRLNARYAGSRVARSIEKYIEKYPGKPVSLVGLSAGTGIAVWALEDLKPGYQVNNVVLLSSSLNHTYDLSSAARKVKGKIYCYYSPHDAVLAGPMKIFGTIDGVYGGTGIGEVGSKSPRGQDRIVNVAYKQTYRKYGYFGGHTDSTAASFVEHVLAKHLVLGEGEAPPSRPDEDAPQHASSSVRGNEASVGGKAAALNRPTAEGRAGGETSAARSQRSVPPVAASD